MEPETGLVTACSLTPANAADGPAGVGLIADEDPGLEVLADSAYGSGEVRAALAKAEHRATIKPIPLRAAIPSGFTLDEFTIDTAKGIVTCPQGVTVSLTPGGAAVFGARCRGCPLRDRCTRSRGGRTIRVHPHHDLLLAARREARTGRFQNS